MNCNSSKLLKYIALSQIKGFGPVTQNALLDICGDIDSCFCVDFAGMMSRDGMKRLGQKRIESFVYQREDSKLWNHAERILHSLELSGTAAVTSGDPAYPEKFRKIKDMPIILYIKGNLRINEFKNSIGIVGARRCSKEGKEVAIDIASMAVDADAAVISGMAKGIDSYAHTAALKNQGYTIAVLGNGADICYPKEHEKLYEKVAEHGCVLSEYPPGTLPREYHFPKRNRLIAALSDRLYVIDAGRHSGTVTTVENGEKYGREIILCGKTEGSNTRDRQKQEGLS